MEEKHYRILALKYRPQTFEEVVGQKHVVQTLVNALRKGKIGQAYLFSGMRGVGKTTVARILAKALNCVHGPTPHPCNKCEFCRAIMNDRAIDVLEIDGAASRKVEEARELREGLKYSPLHSRYKVVIIDEVHMLTPEAFATLLKILEEPPPKTVFIFATTEAHKVPKTIISRCQHFEFNRISQKDIVHHLEYIAQKENLSVSREGLYLIAEAAEGSLRDAESILDKAAAFSGDNISDEDIKILLGTVPQSLLFEVSRVILAGSTGEVFSLVDKLVEAGYELVTFYHQLIHHFRKLLLAKTMSNFKDIIPVNEEEYQQYLQEAAQVSVEELLRYLNALLKEEPALKRSFQPRIYLETVLIKLCHFNQLVFLEEFLAGKRQEGEKEKIRLVDQQGKRKQETQTTPPQFEESLKSEQGLKKTPLQNKAIFPPQEKIFPQGEREITPKNLNDESSQKTKSVTNNLSPPEIPELSSPVSTSSPVRKQKISSEAQGEKESSSPSRSRAKDKLLAEALEEPQVREFMEMFKAQVLAVQPLGGRSQVKANPDREKNNQGE